MVIAQDSRKIRLIMNLRRQGITSTAVLSALERIPREEFVLPAFLDQAYEDKALPIDQGQTISQPYIVALMTQALEVTNLHKVLEIGTGSGYQTAILSKLCRRVYTIERHKPLSIGAQAKFARMRLHNITPLVGDGMKGWPQQAPFDRIIVTAAAWEKPPQDLLDQLKVGGIMVIPVCKTGDAQELLRYKKESEDTYSIRSLVPVRFVPLLPDIARPDENRPANLRMHQEEIFAT